jgi:hypothetical protein
VPANYNGNASNVPADRSDVVGQVLIGSDSRNASVLNSKWQFIYDYLQRLIKKAGFLDLASTWTAKQTFADVDTTGNVLLKGNNTLGTDNANTHAVHGATTFADPVTHSGNTTFAAGKTHTFNGTVSASAGVSSTGAGPNGVGLSGTGVGTGVGVHGQGGANGWGVSGAGGPNGVGVYGLGGSGGGYGVRGDGSSDFAGVVGNGDGTGAGVEGVSQTGPGGRFIGNATRGALHLVPINPGSQPNDPHVGDMWIDTNGVLRIHTPSGSKIVTVS